MFIKREIFSQLKEEVNKKEITLLIGPRQSGKTTLMHLLEEELKLLGHKTVFFNLDIERDAQFFKSQQDLIEKIKLELGENKGFVFIDEIQRKENAGLFLKGLYDLNLGWKFLATGSGSLELKEKIKESLVGRKRIFELEPVNFFEFVNFKTENKYEDRLVKFFEIEKEKRTQFLKEYLNFGGYPRVVLETEIKEKRRVISEIYQSYLERDIAFLLQVKRTEDFSNLVKALAAQIGKLVNFSEFSNTLRISQITIKNYLWYLEKTFIITKITPFYTNLRKEITKMPLYYFNDLGLRNYILSFFGVLENPSEFPFLFENFVFNHLKSLIKDTNWKINFWRTTSGAEVDFVVNSYRALIPIEVKYKNLEKPEITRSLRSFIEKYHPETVYIIHLGKNFKTKINQREIIFLPFWQLREIKEKIF